MKINFITNIKFINQNLLQKPKINFEGKKKDDDIIYGANYDSLTTDDFKREHTIPQIKSEKRSGKDTREEQEKLILSRIPLVVEDAKNFVSQNPQFELDDVIQDLVLLMVQKTNSGMESTKDYRDCSNYASGREWYFKKTLRRNELETSPLIEQYLKVQEEEKEEPPIYQGLEDEAMKKAIDKALSVATPKQELATRMYFGIGEDKKSVQEIMKKLSINRQRVAECRYRAIDRMTKSKYYSELKEFTE